MTAPSGPGSPPATARCALRTLSVSAACDRAVARPIRPAPPESRAGLASKGARNEAGGITIAPSPLPMLTLSLPSVPRATVHPPSTGPTTSSSGTNTSLKNTSLNSAPPFTMRSGRISTPSACMSTTMHVIPWCFGRSGFVRTVMRPNAARCAPVVQTFCPVTSHPPSTRVAFVFTPAASEPASGSLNS